MKIMNTQADTRMSAEMFESMWNCPYPYAGSDKTTTKRMPREEALKLQFIETHAQKAKKFFVLDYDYDESDWVISGQIEDGIIPMPNWITVNPFNGHAQAGFALDGTAGTPKSQLWFDNIFHGLKLSTASDMGYTGAKMRNPTHSGQHTEWLYSGAYSLAEMAKYAEKAPAHFYTKKNKIEELGRNCIEFNLLSAWAYREWRKPNFEVRLLVEAERINQEEFAEKLPLAELVAMCNSIERFINKYFSEEAFSKIQSRRALKRWGTTKQDNIDKYLTYFDAGFSLKEVAELEGKTYNAVKKATQVAKNARKAAGL